jgi:hypothetical protein
MQLAADPIVIEIAGEAYELRPTLRAAMRLARRHGDFATIYKAILADHVTLAKDVIHEGSGSGLAAADFLNGIELAGVRDTLGRLKPSLLEFVLQLAGIDNDGDERGNDPTAEPMPLGEFYAALFRVGTGWLGWSAADTWDATPAEILAAQRGRGDLIGDVLKSIFGTSDEAAKPAAYTPPKFNADGTDSALDRAGLAKLKSILGAVAW